MTTPHTPAPAAENQDQPAVKAEQVDLEAIQTELGTTREERDTALAENEHLREALQDQIVKTGWWRDRAHTLDDQLLEVSISASKIRLEEQA